MTNRLVRTVEIEPFPSAGNSCDEDIKIPLADAIASLSNALTQIPEQYRASAIFRIWGAGEYVSIYPEVRYDIPETDEELEARKQFYKDTIERNARRAAQREKNLFLELKKKYEP